MLDEAIAMRSPIDGAHRSEHPTIPVRSRMTPCWLEQYTPKCAPISPAQDRVASHRSGQTGGLARAPKGPVRTAKAPNESHGVVIDPHARRNERPPLRETGWPFAGSADSHPLLSEHQLLQRTTGWPFAGSADSHPLLSEHQLLQRTTGWLGVGSTGTRRASTSCTNARLGWPLVGSADTHRGGYQPHQLETEWSLAGLVGTDGWTGVSKDLCPHRETQIEFPRDRSRLPPKRAPGPKRVSDHEMYSSRHESSRAREKTRHTDVLPNRSRHRCCHRHDAPPSGGSDLAGRKRPVERPEQCASYHAEMIPVRRRHGASRSLDRLDPKVAPEEEPPVQTSTRNSASPTLVRGELPMGVHRCCHQQTISASPHEYHMNPPHLAFRHAPTRRPTHADRPQQRSATSGHPRGATIRNRHAAHISIRRNPKEAHRSRDDGVADVATRSHRRANERSDRLAMHDPGLTPWISAANVPEAVMGRGPNQSPCGCS
jgi:hypothetical protein